MSDIFTALGALAFAIIIGWFARGRQLAAERREEKARNKALRKEAEKEAETQDDQALIDSITRKRGF